MAADPIKEVDLELPVPEVWRPTYEAIVRSFARGDYGLSDGVPGVARVDPESAQAWARHVADYGDVHLVELTVATWTRSVYQWYPSPARWEVLVDLETSEEGVSDLALHSFVYESDGGYRFELYGIYVP